MDREQALAIIGSFMDLLPAAREEIQEAIEVLFSPQWISVDEELPYERKELLEDDHETELVLIVDSTGFIDTDFMSNYNGTWQWWNNSDATHWLPIPKFITNEEENE